MADFDLSDWEEGCLTGVIFSWPGGLILLAVVLVILLVYFGWFQT